MAILLRADLCLVVIRTDWGVQEFGAFPIDSGFTRSNLFLISTSFICIELVFEAFWFSQTLR